MRIFCGAAWGRREAEGTHFMWKPLMSFFPVKGCFFPAPSRSRCIFSIRFAVASSFEAPSSYPLHPVGITLLRKHCNILLRNIFDILRPHVLQIWQIHVIPQELGAQRMVVEDDLASGRQTRDRRYRPLLLLPALFND